MTTKDAIKLLPIDEELKLQIINEFDTMNPTQRLTIARIAWKTYEYMMAQKIEKNMQEQIEKGMEDKADYAPDENFYANILKQSQKEMDQTMNETFTKVDLTSARLAMRTILDEITAANKKQKN